MKLLFICLMFSLSAIGQEKRFVKIDTIPGYVSYFTSSGAKYEKSIKIDSVFVHEVEEYVECNTRKKEGPGIYSSTLLACPTVMTEIFTNKSFNLITETGKVINLKKKCKFIPLNSIQ
jgi:hypothetical protein